MRLQRTAFAVALAWFGLLAWGGDSALAASHSWRINEVFSNADGTIQFIELKECCGFTGERFIGGLSVTSTATGKSFTFPSNLAGATDDHHLLLATAAFASLPGAPTPDYTIANNFIGINGDTLRYAPTSNYDNFTFGAGVLPTAGTDSIQLTSFTPDQFIIAPNNPTNFAGQTGSVYGGPPCTDVDGDGYGSPGNPICTNGSAQDCNDADPLIHPGAAELCTDGVDNNCNGLTDCADVPECSVPPCIPAVSTWGLAAFSLLLGVAGTLVLRRDPLRRPHYSR